MNITVPLLVFCGVFGTAIIFGIGYFLGHDLGTSNWMKDFVTKDVRDEISWVKKVLWEHIRKEDQ